MTEFSPYRALNRFGLGLSLQDIADSSEDPKGWLLQQLKIQEDPGPDIPDAASSIISSYEFQENRKGLIKVTDSDEAAEQLKALQKSYRAQQQSHFDKRFEYAIQTITPFRERLVQFYSNHFTVSPKGKGLISQACVGYENEAIRGNLDNSFTDMLLGVVSHPVMLIYLDNHLSIGPNSVVGKRSKRGLNENLAREILELHTLGVNGGYKQEDVQALAKMLSGWGLGRYKKQNRGERAGEFYFFKDNHEPGSQMLLGRHYNFEGVDQGRIALVDLAQDPSTARFLATKLARHFISDNPPPEAISILERSFLDSRGHLPTLHRTLVNLEAAWEPAYKKFKSPYDYAVSAVRTFSVPFDERIKRFVRTGLITMNQQPFNAGSPEGWPDDTGYWSSSSALKKRIEWAVALGRYSGANSRTIEQMLTRLPPEADDLKRAMSRAESPAQAASLMLASPDLQWR